MSNQYYYLVTSLPMLKWGEKPAFTVEKFLKTCQDVLSPEEYDALATLSVDPADESPSRQFCPAATAWKEWLAQFHDCLAALRAGRLKRPLEKLARHSDSVEVFLRKRLENAFSLPPDERQDALDRLKWDYLSQASSQYFFDINVLAIYALQLRLLGRILARQVEPGTRFFNSLVEATMSMADSTRN